MNASCWLTTRTSRRRAEPRLIGWLGTSVLILLAPGLSAASPASLTAFLEGFSELGMFDGTVIVDRGGEIVFNESFGRANYEFDIEHDDRTRFRIASVSKALTDAAVARLIDTDRLALDATLAEFLPDFPRGEEITLQHLLYHTSGVPHTNDQPWGDDSLSLATIVARLAKLPLDFDPGTDSNYSNGGYALLARVLEVVTGLPFGDAMREVLLDPLELEDTGHVANARNVIPRMAHGYEPGAFPGERRNARAYAVESRPGGGSLYSTASDLHRFANAVFRESFLPEALLSTVLGADENGYLSQGRSPGFIAKLYYSRIDDVIVVSVANNYAVSADWAAAIAALAGGGRPEQGWPKLVRSAPVVAADDPRIGRYINSFGGGEVEIAHSNRGALVLVDPEEDVETALIPLREGAFILPLYYQLCEQDPDSRSISCNILSGNPRYRSTLDPIAE